MKIYVVIFNDFGDDCPYEVKGAFDSYEKAVNAVCELGGLFDPEYEEELEMEKEFWNDPDRDIYENLFQIVEVEVK